MKAKKAIILARVSTQEQMKEGFSISAQVTSMREYCNRKGFMISCEYEFDESSTREERIKDYVPNLVRV